ncbi:unnamed protein product, partial [Prorocentrum cordatum]
NCCQNILVVDVLAWVHSSFLEADHQRPLIYALDYGRAFPSLSQKFVLFVFQKMGCPVPLINFAMVLYGSIDGAPKNDINRARGDDLGGALSDMRLLRQLRRVMKVGETTAHMCLKPAKCVLTPVSGPVTPELKTRVQDFLGMFIPEWPQFRVESKLFYLGMWMGPAAELEDSWSLPRAKCKGRAAAIGAGNAPASSSAVLHAARRVPALSDEMQFLPLPPQMKEQ